MLSLACLALALCLILYEKIYFVIFSSLFFAVSILMRNDTLVFIGAFFLCLLIKKRSFKSIIISSLTIIIFLYFSNFPFKIAYFKAHYLSHHGFWHGTTLLLSIKNYLTIFTLPVLILFVLGLIFLFKEKRKIFWLTIIGIFPIIAAYNITFNSPKYFLCAIPFLGLAVLSSVKKVNIMPTSLKRILLFVFFIQYLTVTNKIRTVESHDGPRELTGIYLNPLKWQRNKRLLLSEEKNTIKILLSNIEKSDSVFEVNFTSLDTISYVFNSLITKGFLLDKKSTKANHYFFKKDNKTVILNFLRPK